MNSSDSTLSCKETFDEMNRLLSSQKMIRNFSCKIFIGREEHYTLETGLFPTDSLKVYSAWNLEDTINAEDKAKYFSAHRGGSQGDYRSGMRRKIQNVIDCLQKFPNSKRAVITIPNNPYHCHDCDDDSKCMREIHFYFNEKHDRLDATVWMRAQAAEIFPKNIHFIGSLMQRISEALCVNPGELFYLATTLVSVRED